MIKPVGLAGSLLGLATSRTFDVSSYRGGQPISERVRVLFSAADANDPKVRIPKKVGAFRIPKTIRKSRALKALLASQHGRELLTGAVVAGAAAAASSLARSNRKEATLSHTAPPRYHGFIRGRGGARELG